MADITEHAKNNPLVTALLALVVGGGGFNIYQEGAEEKDNDAFRQADIIQDQNYADLLQSHNDMRTELALIRQILE